MIHEKLLIMVSGTLQRLGKHQDQYQYSLLPAQPEEQGRKEPRRVSHLLHSLREQPALVLLRAFP